MRTLVGTSGYSYPAWKGHFYPEDLPAKKFLPFYAERFPTVEINNTFYRMPSAKLVQSWADEVPDSFAFAIKAPQRITHHKRLKECARRGRRAVRRRRPAGRKAGAAPVSAAAEPEEGRAAPDGVPGDAAADLPARRSSSATRAGLATTPGRRCARPGRRCASADTEKLSTPLVATAKWGYLRLRREDYVESDIRDWRNKISAQDWDKAFVYFKHEDAGKGPGLRLLIDVLIANHDVGNWHT